MVNVRMAQDDGIHIRRSKPEMPIHFVGLAPATLVEPAVQKDPLSFHLKFMHGTGYGFGGAVEGKSHRSYSITTAGGMAMGWRRESCRAEPTETSGKKNSSRRRNFRYDSGFSVV
jgi:hypothetical protein